MSSTSRIPSSLMEQMLDESDDEQKESEGVQLVIELDSSRQCTMMVRPKDDPQMLAKKFCFQNNVDPRIIPALTDNIRSVQGTRKPIPQYNKVKQDTTHDETLLGRGDVFQRLYQDGRRRSQSTRSKQNLSSSTLQSPHNHSHNVSRMSNQCHQSIIYEKNRKLQEVQEVRRAQLRKEQQRRQMAECAFRPQINQISNLIASKLRYNDQPQRTSSMLRTKQYLAEKQQRQLQECTFRPQMLKRNNSKQIRSYQQSINNESRVEDRCIQLYEKGKQRAVRRTPLQQSHHPKINTLSEKIIEGTSFMSRLNADDEKRRENMKKKSHSKENRIPSTGRPPRSRSKGNKSIGEHLYEQGRNKIQAIQPLPNTHFEVNARSNVLYDNNKITAFRYLFAVLDSDQDGSISGVEIDIMNIDGQVLRLIAPLLSEMEECAVTLTEKEFLAAISRLFDTLSVHEKNIILGVYRPKIKQEEEMFKPKLNEYSLALAEERRDGPSDLYEMAMLQEADKEARLSEMRALKLLQEYEECTFMPNIKR